MGGKDAGGGRIIGAALICGRGAIMPGVGPPTPRAGPDRPCAQNMHKALLSRQLVTPDAHPAQRSETRDLSLGCHPLIMSMVHVCVCIRRKSNAQAAGVITLPSCAM